MKTGRSRLSPVSRSIAARSVRRSVLTSSRPLTRYEPACVIMISSVSLGAAARTSTTASGSWRLISVSRMKVVDTMRNRTSTSSTSTSEITLISGSSLERFCSFIGYSKYTRPLLMQQRLDEASRLLLDPDYQSVDATAQIAVRDQRGDGDRQTRSGRDQGLGNAACEHGRVRHAVRGDRRERADHAGHGAEQAEQRRDRGDRAERAQVPLEVVNGVAPAVFDDFSEHFARSVPVGEAGREHLPERRAVVHVLDLLGLDLVVLRELPDVVRDADGQHA